VSIRRGPARQEPTRCGVITTPFPSGAVTSDERPGLVKLDLAGGRRTNQRPHGERRTGDREPRGQAGRPRCHARRTGVRPTGRRWLRRHGGGIADAFTPGMPQSNGAGPLRSEKRALPPLPVRRRMRWSMQSRLRSKRLRAPPAKRRV
jgi:hypothetical protein